MDVIESNPAEDTDVSECDGEKVVTMMDVLQEQQEFEDDANAVLGASDDKNCTYSKGYIKRQAIYACLTCCSEARTDPTKRAGVCLACSLNCHENHELIELYTKRNFRCDCGNPKFNSHPCQFVPDKTDVNEENKYNQNFSGLYCICHRPYPDPEAKSDEEMIQCIICEDWLHASHLEATVPANDHYAEMICKGCMEANEFIHDYSEFAVNVETAEVDITTVDSLTNGHKENSAKVNGDMDAEEKNEKAAETMEVDMPQTENKPAESDSVNAEINSSDKPEEEATNNLDKEIADDIGVNSINEMEITKDSEITKPPIDDIQKEIDEEKKEEKESETSGDNDLPAPNSASEENKKTDTKLEESDEASSNQNEEQKLKSDNVSMETTTKSEAENKVEEKLEESAENVIDSVKESKDKIENETNSTDIGSTEETNITKDIPVENGESEELTGEPKSDPPTIESENKTEVDSNEIQQETKITESKVETKETEPEAEVTKPEAQETEPEAKETKSEAQETKPEAEETKPETEETKPEAHKAKPKAEETEQQAKDTESETKLDETNIEALHDKEEEIQKPSVNQNDVEMTDNKEADINDANIETDTSKVSDEKAEKSQETKTKENKRKLSTEETTEKEITSKKPKLDKPCARPKGVKRRFHGATFWPSSFRQKLCTCNECLTMYKHYSVLFLIDPEDTVTAYETLGKEKTNGATTQYEKGLEALSSLDRIQQINALTEYNKMRDKLINYLKSFKERKEVVKEEDIKAFFAEMKPKREPDGVYFCR